MNIIPTQGIHKSEGYKSTFIANFNDEKDGYVELNLKEYKPGRKKAEPVERVYVNYEPKKNLPTHKATLPNQIEKEVKELTSAVCFTNKANQNLTPSQKELLRWNFRLGHIGFQYVQ